MSICFVLLLSRIDFSKNLNNWSILVDAGSSDSTYIKYLSSDYSQISERDRET